MVLLVMCGAASADTEAARDDNFVTVNHFKNVSLYDWNDYKHPNPVFSANASLNYKVAEPTIIYEDGIYKMWARIGNSTDLADDLGHFTSPNGYDWSLIHDDLIRNQSNRCRHPFLMKNGNEYWLYNFNNTYNCEDLWISTDGVNFNIDTWGVFTEAQVGASLIGNVFVWKENVSDWYMIVEHNNPTWSSKYATSSDGKAWTFHNQIMINGFGSGGCSGPWVKQAQSGIYYMIFHGNKGDTGGIPSDIYLAKSTNRQDWTYVPGYELTRECNWEGIGQSGGQAGDPHLVEVSGEIHMAYQGGYDQSPDGEYPLVIAHVHFNESFEKLFDRIERTRYAGDSARNGHDGALRNIAFATFHEGIIGDAPSFNGTPSYIDFGTVSVFHLCIMYTREIFQIVTNHRPKAVE